MIPDGFLCHVWISSLICFSKNNIKIKKTYINHLFDFLECLRKISFIFLIFEKVSFDANLNKN